MDNIHEELADLSANDLPREVRNMFAKYLRTEDKDCLLYTSPSPRD
mgnify:CR=1 FL=1